MLNQSWFVWLVGALVLAVVGISTTMQVQPLVSAPPSIDTGPKTLTLAPKITKPQHDIATFNLFGRVGSKPAVEEPVEQALPETKLKLTLTGIMAGAKDEFAGALIEGPDRQTELYKIGDTLPGNATLHKIYPERIVVERTGRLENLYFPATSSSGIERLANIPAPDIGAPPPNTAVQTRAETGPSSISEERKQSIKDRLSSLRQRIINSRN